ncbi:hypothetical protein QT882_10600, partial [Xanthomonas fragariae]|nr:hypothetical protein [Xanthomonas fragariae]MDM7572811.1 hypothetical protein [Xanthomonas fragariae]MDM7578984.1 hypothetical protein [Xanthomonas fragariae]MDM7589211.1 hypothetical protein [Xanthomonas fragariae]
MSTFDRTPRPVWGVCVLAERVHATIRRHASMQCEELPALEPVHDLLSRSAKKARWMNCKLVLS